MSEIAGQTAAAGRREYLEETYGGPGVLLGGVPGAPPANEAHTGGGSVGSNAARVALGMGACVTVLDTSASRLHEIDEMYRGRIVTMMSRQL